MDGGGARVLFLGTTGRVGRMVARAPDAVPPGTSVTWQRRRGAAGPGELVWDPAAGAGPLRDWARGGARALVVMAGVTPATGAPLSENAAIARACAAAARAAGIPRMLLASSAAVYGARQAPFAETDAPDPPGAYGRAKLEMEAAVADVDDVEVTCLRIGNVAGADALLGRADAAEPLRIDTFADGGGPVRSYIGPHALARVLFRLAVSDAALPRVLNVAAPEPVAMTDLADAAGLAWEPVPAPASAQPRVVLDCARLAALCALGAEASRPETIVAEWRALGDAP